MNSIMEDFGYIASRLAEIEREKQEQREAEAATVTEPAKEPSEDIWGSAFGADIYCGFQGNIISPEELWRRYGQFQI